MIPTKSVKHEVSAEEALSLEQLAVKEAVKLARGGPSLRCFSRATVASLTSNRYPSSLRGPVAGTVFLLLPFHSLRV